ncbi:HdeD family acid-resistance protein [Hoeflea alexandrii]|uniref:HdeD family acid-resistance protein n=1 Tax=Hoeflea alexandrii TaxID=288436 RepID=UPI0022AF72DC|nr:HdeD family acid-resistance protein [Hoeflea alexandrii]MCZ4287506.1 HdeD family acid-resistance protein [Hoeflea alexandrii]
MADNGVNENFGKTWTWMAVLAAICIVGGFLALTNPFGATIFAVTLAGWVFLIQGIIQVFHAFRVRDWTGFLWSLGIGVLSLLVGIVLVADPLAGAIPLTLLVAVLFLATGVAKTMFALALRPLDGWIWVLASGLVSVVLGVMILAGLPATATTILGLLLGIELVSNGVLFLFVALGLRKLGEMR